MHEFFFVFQREVWFLKWLSHPAIATVHYISTFQSDIHILSSFYDLCKFFDTILCCAESTFSFLTTFTVLVILVVEQAFGRYLHPYLSFTDLSVFIVRRQVFLSEIIEQSRKRTFVRQVSQLFFFFFSNYEILMSDTSVYTVSWSWKCQQHLSPLISSSVICQKTLS